MAVEAGTLAVKWWVSSAQSLRFGPAEELLNELRDCARNVYRFWQCVAQRMKPYDFYFLDPRLVSIEFRSSDQRKRRRVDQRLTLLLSSERKCQWLTA